MTKEEYIKRMKEDDEWAPGWDAIDAEFDRLYPGQEPAHYATTIESRAMFGGVEFLEGFSAFDMGNGCRHIVTYGMTELYADEKAFGGAFSRWGYEMTFKIKAQTGEECLWAMDMLSNLARYARGHRFQDHLSDHRCRYRSAIAGYRQRQGGFYSACGYHRGRISGDSAGHRQYTQADRLDEAG